MINSTMIAKSTHHPKRIALGSVASGRNVFQSIFIVVKRNKYKTITKLCLPFSLHMNQFHVVPLEPAILHFPSIQPVCCLLCLLAFRLKLRIHVDFLHLF